MTGHSAPTTTRGRLDVAAVRERSERDPRISRIVEVLIDRARLWASAPTVTQPGELAEWWHVAWERLGDAAFAHAMRPDEQIAEWLRAETRRLLALPVDEWVGPFFRTRTNPPIGALETAHVGLGVAEVLELCPELFDEDEREHIVAGLIEHCLLPCERAVTAYEGSARRYDESGGAEGTPPNNWYMVLLDGFAAISLLSGDADRIATLPGRYRTASSLYNADSYGESVQYWGYATLHLTNVRELLDAHDPSLLARDRAPYGPMMRWVAQSILFQGARPELGAGTYTTMVNFGDSAVTARPPADALTSIARPDAGTDDEDARLARWLFEHTYRDIQLEPSHLSTFGFFSEVGWRSVVNLLSAADASSPEELSLPLAASFETGSVMVRDRWTGTRTVLAAQAGTDRLNVDSHRHDDHGSFVLSHGDELFFADPGHCSYRLEAQQVAKRAESHSTWVLRDGGTDAILERRQPHAAPVGIRTAPWTSAGWTAFSVDLAPNLPETITRARRTWITLLPHVVLIVDDIASTLPVKVETSFVLNDRDHGLRVNQATATRLVLRRGEAAAKFFRLSAETDAAPVSGSADRRWTALHDIYQPQPNAPTQGREGSGVVYSYRNAAGTRHRAVYSIVLDDEAVIRGWHVDVADDGTVLIERPDGVGLAVDPSGFAPGDAPPATQ
ncbi:heparinase II/III domain-containing protein [Microbacterium sp. DT81.1]|uniref:heparinase II/III domain-containing protein n=1 Tax=Microbacterium sp. DT81.1 TaxID=3393413 RepID=UPI003CEEC916